MSKEEISILMNKLNAAIRRGFPDAKNLTFDEKEDSASFSFTLHETNQFSWELKSSGNFIQMRFDSYIDGLTYDELIELSEEMCSFIDKDANAMATDGKIAIQYLYPFDDSDPDLAARNIFYETIEFIHPVYMNIGIFHVNEEHEQIEVHDGFADIDSDDNIFSFDSIDFEFNPDEYKEPEPEIEEEADSNEEYSDEDFEPINIDELFGSDEEFNSQLNDFMQIITDGEYNKEGYKDSDSEDGSSIMFNGSIAEKEFKKAQDTVRSAEGMLDETISSLKTAMDTISNLTASIFIREKEITARETAFEKNKNELEEKCTKFNEDYESFIKEKESFAIEKATTEEIEAKDKEIEDLKAILNETQDGEAKQIYIQELRKKSNYQEEHIEKLNDKLRQCNDIITSLRARYQETKDKAVSLVEEAEQKANKATNMYKNEQATRIANEEQLNELKEEIEEGKNLPSTVDDESVSRLKEELQEATKMVDDAIASADNEKQERLALEDRFNMLKERNDKTEKELESMKMQIADGDVSGDLASIATKVCDDMKNAGINMAPMPGSAQLILSGICQGCETSFDVENRIIFVQKELRKTKQAQAELEHLNNSDIRTSYTLTRDKKLQCKAFCFDIDKCPQLLIDVASEVSSFD